MSIEIITNRASIYNDFTQADLEMLCSNPNVKYLQTRESLSRDSYCRINEFFGIQEEKIQFRLYGFSNGNGNLRFLKYVPNLKNLSIQGFDSVEELGSINALSKLEKLTLSVNKFPAIDFLTQVNVNLRELSIGSPIKAKINLNSIERFSELRHLFVYGIESEYQFISMLKKLKKLTINAVALHDLSFINSTDIEDLSLGFTGKYNLSQLCGNLSISKLSLWKNISISNLDVLQGLPNLRHCELKELSKVEKFPNLRQSRMLHSIVLDTMSKMNSISELMHIPSIQSLKMYQMKRLAIEEIREVLKRRKYDEFVCTTGNTKIDNELKNIIEMQLHGLKS